MQTTTLDHPDTRVRYRSPAPLRVGTGRRIRLELLAGHPRPRRSMVERAGYSHGILVPFISAYLIWSRWDALRAAPVTPGHAGLGVMALALMYITGSVGADLFPPARVLRRDAGRSGAVCRGPPSCACPVSAGVPPVDDSAAGHSFQLHRLSASAFRRAGRELGSGGVRRARLSRRQRHASGGGVARRGRSLQWYSFAACHWPRWASCTSYVHKSWISRLLLLPAVVPIAIIANVFRVRPRAAGALRLGRDGDERVSHGQRHIGVSRCRGACSSGQPPAASVGVPE